MKHTIPCEVIEDLLPLYMDELVSDKTTEEIETHLKDCPACQEKYSHMKNEIIEKEAQKQSEAKSEINYLKSVKKSGAKKALFSALAVLLICGLALFTKLFVIGSPSEAYYTTYIDAYEDSVHIGGVFYDSASVYCRYKIVDDEFGCHLVLYHCLPSPWNRSGTFNLEIPMDKVSDQLFIGDYAVKKDGTTISALANRLFRKKNPYIGDMSANGQITSALNLANEMGNFKNELQTTDVPYGWTLIFENSTNNSAVFEEKMKGYACILIALIDNLGEVSWEYTVELADGPVTRKSTMTEADCTAYLGAPIKDFSQSPETVQELLELLASEHELYFYNVN